MRFLLSSALKDLERRLADPIALLIWIGIPLVIGTLITVPFGGGTARTPKAHLLLVDQDDSLVSRLLAAAGSGGQLGKFLEIEQVDLQHGRERIDAGEATALLILPPGFAAGVFEEKPTQLTLITNPSEQILPGLVQQGLEILLEASFYLQRLIGAPLRQLAGGPPGGASFFPDQTIATFSAEINRRLRSLQGTLLPPLLKLETEVEKRGPAAEVNIGSLFLPGVLFMALMFIASGMSDDIWREKNQGALLRLVSTPQPLGLFLGGKLVAAAILMAAVTLVGLLVGVLAFGLRWERLPLALGWCTFAGVALLSFFLLIQLFSSSQRGGNLLSTMILFPLLMLGGSFFPFEIMPDWMAALGRWTPNGLAVARLKEILLGQPATGGVLTAALGIGLPALLALWIAARRLRRGFITG